MYAHERPLVGSFHDESLSLMTDDDISLLVFVHEGRFDREIHTMASNLAPKYRYDLAFSMASYESKSNKDFLKALEIKKKDLPTMVILQHHENLVDDLNKFKYLKGNKFNSEDVEDFIRNWKGNNLERFYVSEIEPSHSISTTGIHTLVASSLNKAVTSGEKDILLLLCVSLSKTCKRMEFVYNFLAQKLKNSEKLLIAHIDPSLNELPQISFKEFPHLVVLPQGEKSNYVHYNGNFTVVNIIDFVRNNAKNPLTVQTLDNEEKLLKKESNNPVHIPGEDRDLVIHFAGYGKHKAHPEHDNNHESDHSERHDEDINDMGDMGEEGDMKDEHDHNQEHDHDDHEKNEIDKELEEEKRLLEAESEANTKKRKIGNNKQKNYNHDQDL
jgi:hypothetical protein